MGNTAQLITPPNFSKGIFKEILLSDRDASREISDHAQSAVALGFVVYGLGIGPLAYFYFGVPFAQSQKLGVHTYEITVVGFWISMILLNIANFMSGFAVAPEKIPVIWEKKVRRYGERVRNILISHTSTARMATARRELILESGDQTNTKSDVIFELLAN